MSITDPKTLEHIFQSLRNGVVPRRGLEAFAVGIERERAEIARQLDLTKGGDGNVRFLRGDYGCGKTFMARLALDDAQAQGFVTSFVVVSENDLKFHNFEDVYARVVSNLATATCPRGALDEVLDRWVTRVEDRLIDLGADMDAPDFDEKVRDFIDQELARLTGGNAPADFVRVIQTVFALKQKRQYADAAALLSWLSGSPNVSAQVKKLADVKGEISSRVALSWLRGIVAIVREAGFSGLVIAIDEAETILRMRSDTRHRSLNGIRQICDEAADWPGLLWLFTGTPEFFDSRRGVNGLAPLDQRIGFRKIGEHVSLRQPQILLRPFDEKRLAAVARLLRDLFPARDREHTANLVHDEFIAELVTEATRGFRGDVGVVPRQFLRQFGIVLDLTDEDPDFDPSTALGFGSAELSPEEERRLSGAAPELADEDEGPELVPVTDAW